MKPRLLPTFAARCLLAVGLGMASVPLAAIAAHTGHTFSRQEQAFIAKATADNSMQIALARLVLGRSPSPEVQALAQRILHDHSALNRKFTRFSVGKTAHSQAHGTTPADVTEDKLQLGKLQGKALGQAFAGMMVAEHEKIIPLYEDAARNSHDPGLQRIAREGLPMLRDHLQAARAIASK